MRIFFGFAFVLKVVKEYLSPCKDSYFVGISPYYVECPASAMMERKMTEVWEENIIGEEYLIC